MRQLIFVSIKNQFDNIDILSVTGFSKGNGIIRRSTSR